MADFLKWWSLAFMMFLATGSFKIALLFRFEDSRQLPNWMEPLAWLVSLNAFLWAFAMMLVPVHFLFCLLRFLRIRRKKGTIVLPPGRKWNEEVWAPMTLPEKRWLGVYVCVVLASSLVSMAVHEAGSAGCCPVPYYVFAGYAFILACYGTEREHGTSRKETASSQDAPVKPGLAKSEAG